MLQRIFAFSKASRSVALLVSLPVALMATVAIAQQMNQEEICPLETKKAPVVQQNLPARIQVLNRLQAEAMLALKAGNYSKAETILLQAVETGKSDAFTYFNLAEALRFQRKFEEAISTYRKAIEQDSSYSYACSGWAKASIKSVKSHADSLFSSPDDYSSSEKQTAQQAYIECARLRIKLQPNNYRHYEYISDVWVATGSFDNAIEARYKALQLLPCNVDSFRISSLMYFLSKILQVQSRLHEILPIYDKLIQRYPAYASGLYIQKGRALLDLERPQDASDAFDRSIQLNPKARDLIKIQLELQKVEQMQKLR